MGLYNREPDADPNSARSRTGYVLTLGGFPLIWKSQLQTSIATDTACAEYQALSTALRAFIPIREVLFEIADVSFYLLHLPLPSSLRYLKTTWRHTSSQTANVLRRAPDGTMLSGTISGSTSV